MSDESNTTAVATTQTAAVAAKPQGLKGWLMSPQFAEQIAVACGDAIDPKHFIRVALTAVNKNPKLADCTKESVLQCCLDAASFGVETNGRDAHLIPYGKQCTLIIDYKGYVRLVMNTGLVSNIHADVVCENDEFEYNLGEVKKHVIDLRKPRGPMYAAYCIVTMKDGTKKAEVMSKDEIDAIRRRSRSGSSGPWVTDTSEMQKKTVFRRLQKWLPLSPEVQEKLDKDMRAEFAEIAEQMRSQPRKGFIAELASETLAGDPTPEGETLELPTTEGSAQ